MSGLPGQLGLWCGDSGKILGNLHAVQDLGFDYLIARAVIHPHGRIAAYEPANLKQLITDAATINLPVYAWAYIYPTHIDNQIRAIADAVPESCVNLVLDAEVEWEKIPQGAALAHQLVHGIAEAMGHRADLHLSTFCNPESHPLPMTAFLAHCESFMPQSYRIPPTRTQTVLQRTLKQCPPLAVQSLGNLLIPTVNRPEMLAAVAAHPTAFPGANVWLWDGDKQDPGVAGIEGTWMSAIKAFHDAHPTSAPG